MRKIAFEEHYTAPGFEAYSKVFARHIDGDSFAELGRRLADFDELRLQDMDENDIDYAILSQTGPGVQGEPDAALALTRARENNDFLAERISRNPGRYGGFAVLPMHDPEVAARELERTVREHGFKGALINGHTNGTYYDGREYDAFWQTVEALQAPIYLHPADAYVMPHVYSGHPVLERAAWGWGVETASHALRLLFGGVFDRFPGVRLVLGHMGEGLPYLRWRFDSRFAMYPHGVTLERAPSAYIGSNIVITTSGVCSHAALQGAIDEMGAEAVMFSVDYPYESSAVAAHFIETAPLDDATRALVCHGNAERLFRL